LDLNRCFTEAETLYGVPSWLLWSIAKVESDFRPRATNTNRNGSEDIGLMQINSAWLPTLRRHGITKAHLWDACTNIKVGAWVVAQNIRALGWNWDAIGAYNARSPEKRRRYAWKIYRAVSDAGGPR
jgi:soluble lytic murein transglycosylase-like protein